MIVPAALDRHLGHAYTPRFRSEYARGTMSLIRTMWSVQPTRCHVWPPPYHPPQHRPRPRKQSTTALLPAGGVVWGPLVRAKSRAPTFVFFTRMKMPRNVQLVHYHARQTTPPHHQGRGRLQDAAGVYWRLQVRANTITQIFVQITRMR
jgi:hypothetical protein